MSSKIPGISDVDELAKPAKDEQLDRSNNSLKTFAIAAGGAVAALVCALLIGCCYLLFRKPPDAEHDTNKACTRKNNPIENVAHFTNIQMQHAELKAKMDILPTETVVYYFFDPMEATDIKA